MTEREEELLSAYLDGALDGEERGEIERLLAGSAPARALLGAMRRDGELLRRVAASPEPDARELGRMRREVLAAAPVPESGWVERLLAALEPRRIVALGLPLALALLVALPGRPPVRLEDDPDAGPVPGRGIEVRELTAGAGDAFGEVVVDEGAVVSRVPVPGLGIDVLWVMQ